MAEPDLFETQDDAIYRMWMAGARAREIGLALGIDESRIIHEVNRILRERAPK